MNLSSAVCVISKENSVVKGCRDQAITQIHRRINPTETLQRSLPQTAANGIADDQRANQRCAADRSAQDHAQMRARMEPQASANECPDSHIGKLSIMKGTVEFHNSYVMPRSSVSLPATPAPAPSALPIPVNGSPRPA